MSALDQAASLAAELDFHKRGRALAMDAVAQSAKAEVGYRNVNGVNKFWWWRSGTGDKHGPFGSHSAATGDAVYNGFVVVGGLQSI